MQLKWGTNFGLSSPLKKSQVILVCINAASQKNFPLKFIFNKASHINPVISVIAAHFYILWSSKGSHTETARLSCSVMIPTTAVMNIDVII